MQPLFGSLRRLNGGSTTRMRHLAGVLLTDGDSFSTQGVGDEERAAFKTTKCDQFMMDVKIGVGRTYPTIGYNSM